MIWRRGAEPAGRRTIGGAFGAGANNFDLMRLGAALLVLASHAYVLTGQAEREPFAPLLGHMTDGGGLAVAMFFVLSGFLIARSAEVHGAWAFVRARALRIYPAFAVLVAVQTFGVGLWATRLSAGGYLGDWATWDAFFRALVFSPRVGLPGVFERNPLPLAVNGSLWTLRIEVLCYAGVLLLSFVGGLRRGWVLLVVGAGFAGVGAVVAARVGWAPAELAGLRVVAIVDCGVHFAMGMAAWCYRDWVPRRGVLAGGGVLLLVVAAGTVVAPFAWHLVLPYLVLWVGTGRVVGVGLMRGLGDVSYGTYLYAFPIEQMVVGAQAGIGPVGLMAMAAPLTLGCAVLSRWLIEVPALRLR